MQPAPRPDKLIIVGGPMVDDTNPLTGSASYSKKSTSGMAIRNNFEHRDSRKAILKHYQVEIEKSIGTIWKNNSCKKLKYF